MDRPILQPWWRKKHWVQAAVAAFVVVLVLITAALLFGSAERSVRMTAANVTIAEVTEAAFHDFVPLRAKVVALNTVYLDALEGGRVERVLAQAGDDVAEGQPLVDLTNTQLELDVLDREGRLIESITQLQAYETQLEQKSVVLHGEPTATWEYAGEWTCAPLGLNEPGFMDMNLSVTGTWTLKPMP